MELLQPSEKYINFIENSHHYLNCPKHKLNEDIRTQIRFNWTDKEAAKSVVKAALKYYDIKCNDLDKLIFDHIHTSEADFMKLNVNAYIDKMPAYIYNLSKRIDDWYKANVLNPKDYLVGCPMYHKALQSQGYSYPHKYIL